MHTPNPETYRAWLGVDVNKALIVLTNYRNRIDVQSLSISDYLEKIILQEYKLVFPDKPAPKTKPYTKEEKAKEYRNRHGSKIGLWKRESARKRRAIKNKSVGRFTEHQFCELKEIYDYTCLRCKRREPDIVLTRDHVVPLILGGSDDIDNIQPLCRSCNSKKHTKIIDYRLGFCTIR